MKSIALGLLPCLALSGCMAGLGFKDVPYEAPRRGTGTMKHIPAPQQEVRAAILDTLEKMRQQSSEWKVEDQGNSLHATYRTETTSVGTKIVVLMAQHYYLSPGPDGNGTNVEVINEYYSTPDMGHDQKMKDSWKKSEFALAEGLPDQVKFHAWKGKGSPPREAPVAAQAAAPSRRETPKPVQPALTSDVDHPRRSPAFPRPEDFALVVGIEKYQRLPSADYAERDARAMKEHLISLGVPDENAILLTGQQATLTGMAKYLEEWLPRNTSPESRVYFFYSGHGAPDLTTGRTFLVPWDGDATFLQSSAYPLSRLYDNLKALRAREVVVFLDSCFSGSGGRSVIAKGARPLVPVVAVAASDPRISVLSASSSEEVTGSLDDQGHGLFTYFLLKALQGEGGSGEHLSLKDAAASVQKNVQRAARRQNREQTPHLRSGGQDLLLY